MFRLTISWDIDTDEPYVYEGSWPEIISDVELFRDIRFRDLVIERIESNEKNTCKYYS